MKSPSLQTGFLFVVTFSINIKNDLEDYKKIIPCGLNNKKITSIKKERKVPMKIKENLKNI